MEITEVRIKLMEEPNDRLQAFCSITIDGSFVIRDLKIIQGTRGPFVAMPSRKLNDRCSKCGHKNELRAGYCSNCGGKLNQERATRDQHGRAKLYADIAHPINTECREMIQNRVLEAFTVEQVRAKESGYICRYDDYGESAFAESYDEPSSEVTKESSTNPPAASPKPTPIELQDGKEHRVDQAENAVSGPHVGTPARKQVAPANTPNEDDPFGIGVE